MGDAFPPSRHIPQGRPTSSDPRQTANKLTRLTANSDDQTAPPVDTQQQQKQPRFRASNRLTGARKLAIPKEESPPATATVKSEPTRKSYRNRPGIIKSTVRSQIDPVEESGYNNEPGQSLLQRSISNQSAKPVNQFLLRKAHQKSSQVNGGRTTTERPDEEAEISPSKPTRRTFTRKPAVVKTTPASLRVTKRYQKKTGSKVETSTTTTSPPPSTTEAIVKPFRVATRHQKLKLKPKPTKKYDEDGDDDNYPEHFKLLLKNKSQEDLKSPSPTKLSRSKLQRIETSSVASIDKTLLRKQILKPKPRPLLKNVAATTVAPVVPTSTQHSETANVNLVEEEVEGEDILPIRDQETQRFSPQANREGRTFTNQLPSRNERVCLQLYWLSPPPSC